MGSFPSIYRNQKNVFEVKVDSGCIVAIATMQDACNRKDAIATMQPLSTFTLSTVHFFV
jgi:hypothetical protein